MYAGLEDAGNRRARGEDGDGKDAKKVVADDDLNEASLDRLQSGTVNEGMQLTAKSSGTSAHSQKRS
eukprot:3086315-Pyramimonas_sp.AAC.1